MFRTALFIALILMVTGSSAGIGDWLRGLLGQEESTQRTLSQREMVQGVREALSVGVRRAIDTLGRQGGFGDDPAVRIPLPDALSRVGNVLRTLGQGRHVDEFVATMNRAAEQAVPHTADIFIDTIRGMSIADARAILGGPDDAATRYFEQRTRPRLTDAVLPIVRQATSEVRLTAHYKTIVDKAGFAKELVGAQALDLDRYVTEQALDGLFLKLAEEERRIRQDPVARSTELLKKVFGAAIR